MASSSGKKKTHLDFNWIILPMIVSFNCPTSHALRPTVAYWWHLGGLLPRTVTVFLCDVTMFRTRSYSEDYPEASLQMNNSTGCFLSVRPATPPAFKALGGFVSPRFLFKVSKQKGKTQHLFTLWASLGLDVPG